ncbi:hypothetical protein TWF696_006744 [Orbilia brochopaga]|uniref:Secreted protein n=1 Tax=Orbilia brochopaga TaxID=3140254 RepID=A0AAV9UQI7_9PEZI
MLTFTLLSIASLIWAVTATPVPAPGGPSPAYRPKGNAWADVTSCHYVSSYLDAARTGYINTYYVGTIVQYNTWNGASTTIYSQLAPISNNTCSRIDLKIPFCTSNDPKVNRLCFQGSWQATQSEPNPSLYMWNSPSSPTAYVLPAASPNEKVPANNNAAQTLCLQKWPVSSLPGIVSNAYCVTNDGNGKLAPPCAWGSATWSYYNLPNPL